MLRWPWSTETGENRDVLATFPETPALMALAELPLPGQGETTQRFVALAEVGASDLSTARLVEGHADAVAIFGEAGRAIPYGCLGVWGAAPDALRATRTQAGWHLHGTKPWCSGASTVDVALLTARCADGPRLFVVPTKSAGLAFDVGSWPAVGMAGSDTLGAYVDVALGDEAAVGEPGWYTERPGFWFGSMGVAACWLGGAVGAVRGAAHRLAGERHAEPHELAKLGAAAARCELMAAAVERAAAWVDAHPADPAKRAHTIALGLRQGIEEACLSVAADAGRAGGAGAATQDADQARRLADLPIYVRQHHAADAAAYACLLLESGVGDG